MFTLTPEDLMSPLAPEVGTEGAASATGPSILASTAASVVGPDFDVPRSPPVPTVEGSALTTLGCAPQFDIDAMTSASASANANCTSGIACNPGATIVSPIILSFMGVTGQLAALYILHRTTRRQNARTVFYVMLCTLIWTDFFGKITTTPPAILAYALGSWTGGLPLCYYHGYIMMVITMVTHLLVSSMALERFLGIRHTYMYNRILTLSRAKFLLVGIWVFSLLFCALPMLDVGEYALQYPGTWCYLSLHPCSTTPLRHLLYANTFALFNVVCLVFLVFCNVVVVGTLLKMRMFRYKFSPSKSCQPHRTSKQRELEVEMVIVLVVLTFVFTVSWAPLDLRVFLNQFWPHEKKEDHFIELVSIRLVSINQIIDPWAYIISRFLFRSRFCRCCRTGLLQRLSQRKNSNSLVSLRRDSANSQRRESARSRKDSATTGLSQKRRESDMSLRKHAAGLPPHREPGTVSLKRESEVASQQKEPGEMPWREGDLQRRESENLLQGTGDAGEPSLPASQRKGSDAASLRKDSGNSSQLSSKRSSMSETPLLADLGLDHLRYQQVQEEEEHLQENSKLLRQEVNSDDVMPNGVPIPIFTCEQYTLLPPQHHHPEKSKNDLSEELILSVTRRTCRSLQGSPFKEASGTTLPSCGCTSKTRGVSEHPKGGRSSSWGCSMDVAPKHKNQLVPSTLAEDLECIGSSRLGSLAMK
ncbi:uncharacterized protein LOC143028333 isoform X2 [Oratosquilla oratoria]|uniref:uncharacterized protein LOC143028333 isoform X2 n=1 Tax=Oratosquilla oratoria TaxID=337810 RepID=UPI003F757C5F